MSITPFSHDYLAENTGSSLLKIVEALNGGEVICLDGGWGTGKTHFCKKFAEQVEKAGYRCLYFDAFKNDFQDDVLVSLLGEMVSLEDKGERHETVRNFSKWGKPFLKGVTKAALKGASRGIIDLDEMDSAVAQEAAKEMMLSTEAYLSEAIDNYGKKEESLALLKSKFESLATAGDKKGLVFIVDELDRCRPNFAIEIIEKIKHVFEVDYVTFLLSMNKAQMYGAVKHLYGCENKAAEIYLDKFISTTVSLSRVIEAYNDSSIQRSSLYQYAKEKCSRDLAGLIPADMVVLLSGFIGYYAARQSLSYREVNSVLNKIKILAIIKGEEEWDDEVVCVAAFIASVASNFNAQKCMNVAVSEQYDNVVAKIFFNKGRVDGYIPRAPESRKVLEDAGIYPSYLYIYSVLGYDGDRLDKIYKSQIESLYNDKTQIKEFVLQFLKVLAAV